LADFVHWYANTDLTLNSIVTGQENDNTLVAAMKLAIDVSRRSRCETTDVDEACREWLKASKLECHCGENGSAKDGVSKVPRDYVAVFSSADLVVCGGDAAS